MNEIKAVKNIQVGLARKFNNVIMKLINIIYAKNPENGDILSLKSKFIIYCKSEQESPVKACAPELRKYSENIINKNEYYFLSDEFKEEIRQKLEGQRSTSLSSSEIFGVVFGTFSRLTTTEKEILWAELNALVTYYKEYDMGAVKLSELVASYKIQQNTQRSRNQKRS